MAKRFMKRSFFCFIFLFCFACQHSETNQKQASNVSANFDVPATFSERIEQASLIFIGEVQRLELWKGRSDWWVVTLKPEKMIKGNSTFSLKILSPKLFPNEPLQFKEGERVFVMLRELPPYTAWKDLIAGGVRYDVLGGEKGIYKTSPDISLYSDYAEQALKIQKIIDELERKKKLQSFYEEILQKNPPGNISTQIVEDYFQLLPAASLSESDRQFLLARVKDPRFLNDAKVIIVNKMSEIENPEMNQSLQELFCLLPSPVCLRVAETLESRSKPLPLNIYTSSIGSGPDDLKIGLLTILARHHRKDAFKLFEKYLKQEKNEKNASSLMEALGDFQIPQAENLTLSYAKDPRYYVRLAVAMSLGKLKSSKGIPVLEEYLKTQDPSVVMVTAQALKEIGTPQALKTLGKYYQMGHHGHWEPAEPQHFNLPPANP